MAANPAGTSETRRRYDRLRALAHDPPRLAAFAAEILPEERNADILVLAANALRAHPLPGGRELLLRRFREYAASGPRLDRGAIVRAALLHALRPVALAEDEPLLLAAALAYEGGIQGPVTAGRAAALIALNERDGELGTLIAVRCIAEADDSGLTDRMTGEPALTALRVLAANGDYASIYATLLAPPQHQELIAEALRGIAGAPAVVIAHVLERYGGSASPVVALGLCDLVVQHPRIADTRHAVRDLLAGSPVDVFGYLATAIVASRRDDLLAILVEHAQAEAQRAKRIVLRDALALAHTEEARALARALAETTRPD